MPGYKSAPHGGPRVSLGGSFLSAAVPLGAQPIISNCTGFRAGAVVPIVLIECYETVTRRQAISCAACRHGRAIERFRGAS